MRGRGCSLDRRYKQRKQRKNEIIISEEDYDMSKKLILVVDDDTDLVEMVAMKLESKNFRVAKAYDGVEAMAKIQEERRL